MEKELLSVVMLLKEFRTFLLGSDLHIFTDHKNLTYPTLNSSKVLRWRLYLEEYGPKFHYIKGTENVLADTFLRLPRKEPTPEGKKPPSVVPDEKTDTGYENFSFSLCDSEDTFDCFLNYPQLREMQMPIKFARIRDLQETDQDIQLNLQHGHPSYVMKQMTANISLVFYRATQQTPESEWRIVIPTALLEDAVLWYH